MDVEIETHRVERASRTEHDTELQRIRLLIKRIELQATELALTVEATSHPEAAPVIEKADQLLEAVEQLNEQVNMVEQALPDR